VAIDGRDECNRKSLRTTAVSHVVSCGVKRSMSEKVAMLLTKSIFRTVAVSGGIFCGAERMKRFVNVNLHCIVSNLKRISKRMTLHPLEKFRQCTYLGKIH